MLRKHLAAALLLLVPALGLAPRAALAAWPNLSGVNLPVCKAASNQYSQTIASDGVGGAFITWYDLRSGPTDIYAQHVLASGIVDPAWPVDGRVLCAAANDQYSPVIVADGAGGAIVAWFDVRGGATFDIYAQHVLASGTVDPAWPVNGRALCTATFDQAYATIVTDGAGGAIVAWQDFRNGSNYDVYAQHVLASGAVDPAWPLDGRPLCTASNTQNALSSVADGAGGSIVAWQDVRGGTADIYAEHVLANGTVDPNWPFNGRAVCTAANDQNGPTIVADGAGGAIIAWYDIRSGTSNDVYAMHVQANGQLDPGWPVNGRALCTATGDQGFPTTLSDGAGGAIVTWHDARSGPYHIYAQHVLPSGAVDPAWPVDGRALSLAAGNQNYPFISTDGGSGAIITWYDYRNGVNADIYAQHVLATGVVDATWPTDGRAISTASNDQINPIIAADGAGGAMIAWMDYRTGAYDIYAQRVARFGYLGTPEAEITGAKDVPNDNGGRIKLSWNASWLDSNSDPNLAWYEIYRSVPPNFAAAAMARGAHVLRDFSEAPALDAENVVTGALGYSWEYLATQNALHYISNYSYLAATAEDSTGYQNPKTAFMIVARNSSGTMYWLSRPDSGYSVDNLPPLAPAPFTGNYSSGTAHLHWNPNSETDFANYRLYRGTTAGFVPGPGNQIASPPDTGYADVAVAGFYYKLSAIDTHGNESGFALLTPGGTLDVTGGAPALELALQPSAPNPASTSSMLRYSMPREANVTLSIYDAGGRLIRTLAGGVQPAGQHQVTWDLRDAAGHAVGAGLYLVRLEVEGRSLVRRMTAMR